MISHLLGSHPRYARVPIECRFHCNPQGFPDLLSGAVGPDAFMRKLRKFWWRRIRAGEVAPVVAKRIAFGRKVRGLHKMVEEDRYCADIMTQIASVHEALRSVGRELMRNHLKHCAATAIRAGDEEAEAMYDELIDLMYRSVR